ncbi:MAG: hypothetical protein ABI954_01465 [Pyrinomonadaceae bacterium]
MPNSKKILITTESYEIFTVRTNGKSAVRGFCSDCAAEVEMLTLDEAVDFLGKSAWEILKLVDARLVHLLETANGHLLVCRKSLETMQKEF